MHSYQILLANEHRVHILFTLSYLILLYKVRTSRTCVACSIVYFSVVFKENDSGRLLSLSLTVCACLYQLPNHFY